MTYRLSHGDCIELMRAGKAEKIDAIVCDPPYGIEFMGKTWDSPKRMVGEATGISGGFQGIPAGVPRPDMSKTDPLLFQEWCAAWGAEAMRVLKPGGHILAFGGTRMFHRLTAGLEDAGFEIRDTLMWIYGSGFPKGDNIEKGINKHFGVEFEERPAEGVGFMNTEEDGYNNTANRLVQVGESHELALPWRDWNTNLKPAYEPIILARKPRRIPGKRPGTTKKANTVQCVLEHGTGAINIGACRVGSEQMVNAPGMAAWNAYRHDGGYQETDEVAPTVAEGRWPANVILTHHPLCESTGEAVVVPGDARVNVELDGTREGGFVNIGADSGDGTPNGQVYGDQEVEVWRCHEDCPVRIMDQQAPRAGAIARVTGNQDAVTGESGIYGHFDAKPGGGIFHGDGLGGASRFFKQVGWDECDRAISADPSSSPEGQPLASAQDHAAIEEPRAETPSGSSTGSPSTSATQIASSENAVSGTHPTPSIGAEHSPGQRPVERTQIPGPASDAEQPGPTGITTTTIDQPTSAGSVAGATLEITPPFEAPGDLACASRFMYHPKASPSERKAGLDGRNIHPTVKPIALMEYLCRLITPAGGLILDPFMGSGTTGIAALRQGFKFVGMEQDENFLATAQSRINHYIDVEDANQEVGRT